MSFEEFYETHAALETDKTAAFVEGDNLETERTLEILNELHADHPEHTLRAWQITLAALERQRAARGELYGV